MAAYAYMALVPMIQPDHARAEPSEKERRS